MSKKRMRVSATTTVYTFAYLRNVSWACRKRAREQPAGSNLFAASSMVFTAFSIEAYLNHLGSSLVQFWDKIERKLSPTEKLDLLSKTLGIDLDYGTRPFRTFAKMFAFRNALAHGRTESLTEDSLQLLSEDDIPDLPRTTWEEAISIDSASRYLDDAKAIVAMLNQKAGLDPDLLWTPGTAEYQIAPIAESEDDADA